RDPQLRLIDLPDSIASRLESAWRKARADLEARWGAHVMAKRVGLLWEGPLRDTLGGLGRWAELAARPLRRQEAPETARRPSAAEEDTRRRVLEGATVLVVDDAADDREAMRALFETLGARVISAGNGQEAMDRLREAGADVVLCDLRMPQVDGFEFIRRLRADPKCHGLPAIAVSGVGSGGSRLRARELARDGRLAVAEGRLGRGEEGREPARRLEEEERPRLTHERRETGRARPGSARQEALEDEALGREARHRDEGGERRRTGHGHDRDAGGERPAHQVIAGIRDPRRAGVGDERDRRAGPEPLDESRRALALDGVVVAGER